MDTYFHTFSSVFHNELLVAAAVHLLPTPVEMIPELLD